MRHSTRPGFSLVELLIVIAIIGLLLGLLFPAVQAARESTRRLQCAANLRQLGLALLTYHTANRTFPAASTWFNSSDMDGSNTSKLGPNWVISILPFLDQEPLYQLLNLGTSSAPVYLSDDMNATLRGTQLSVMLCGSDPYNRIPYDGSRYGSPAPVNSPGKPWARGNYGAIGGLDFAINMVGPTSTSWNNAVYRGTLGINCAVMLDHIPDGTSNTFLVAELRAGLTSFDSRGTWALSGTPSSLWGHGWQGDDNGPNCVTLWPDDMVQCNDVTNAVGGYAAIVNLGMPCYSPSGSFINQQQTARSMHPSGVQTAFADGSVHFISNYIELSTPGKVDPVTGASPYLAVWDRLNLSMDGKAISGNTY